VGVVGHAVVDRRSDVLVHPGERRCDAWTPPSALGENGT
jgi:hypothetical protein